MKVFKVIWIITNIVSGSSARSGKIGVKPITNAKSEAAAPVSDMLTLTGGILVVVVGVAVESVKKGVDCATDTWGCETPIETFRHGVMKMGVVVAVGKGGMKSYKIHL